MKKPSPWTILVRPEDGTKDVGIGQLKDCVAALSPCCLMPISYNVTVSSWCCESCSVYVTYGRVDVPGDCKMTVSWTTERWVLVSFVEGWTGLRVKVSVS